MLIVLTKECLKINAVCPLLQSLPKIFNMLVEINVYLQVFLFLDGYHCL